MDSVDASTDGNNVFSQTNCFTGLDVGRGKSTQLIDAIAEEASDCEANETSFNESESNCSFEPEVTANTEKRRSDEPLDPTEHLVVVGNAVKDMELSGKIEGFLEAMAKRKRLEMLQSKKAINERQTHATKETKTSAAKTNMQVAGAWVSSNMHASAPRHMSRTIPNEIQVTRRRSDATKNITKLTTEELELKKAAEAMAAQSKRVQQNQRSVARSKMYTTSKAVRSTKALTIPASPSLVTKQLLGKKVAPVAKCPVTAVKPLYNPTKLTVACEPKFHATTRTRAPTEESTVVYQFEVPLAEAIYKMQNSAPDRFHDKIKPAPNITFTGKVTVPQSPKLHHSHKSKPAMMSTRELEERAIKERKNHQFKARPFNPKIIECNGTYGVPKIASQSITVPEAFSFGTTHRPSTASAPSKDEEEMAFRFKARPMPKKTSVGSGGESVAPPRNLTVPRSPHLRTSHRPRTTASDNNAAKKENYENEPPSKSGHRTSYQISGKTTKAKPFNLSTEHRCAMRAEQRITTSTNDGVDFHARQMPNYSNGPDFVPKASGKPLTDFKVFNLRSYQRHERKVAEFEERIAEQNQRKSFHARPAPRSSMGEVFKVKYPQRTPLQAQDVNLASSVRAVMRKEFDKANALRLASEAAHKKAILESRIREEDEVVKAMRRRSIEEGGMAFKAKDIEMNTAANVYGPKTSARELTIPITPKLATLARSHFRRAVEG